MKQKWYSEQNLIDNVARFVPWLAPGIPAVFAYMNSRTQLDMEWPIALLIALTVEGLGLASVHTALSLVEHIKTHKQNQPKTEAWIMFGMTLFYLAIVVTVNIILDLQHPVQIIIAKALLSLVSIPAAVTLSIRQLHKTRLTNESEQKAEKTAQGKLGVLTKKYNQLEQTNKELKQTIQGLQQQIKEQSKQKPVQTVSRTESKPTNKRQAKVKQPVEQISCPDCGKVVKGIKGLNGHSRFCEAKQPEIMISSNGYNHN